MKNLINFFMVLLILAGLVYAGFLAHRWINWKLWYEDKVREVVVQELEKSK